jgi:hypothetical protein
MNCIMISLLDLKLQLEAKKTIVKLFQNHSAMVKNRQQDPMQVVSVSV